MTKQIIIYTDGACRGNPGPGGWGVILCYNNHQKELYGSEQDTTNNRMELTAAIMGLRELTEPCEVTLVTDSQYLRQGITQWIHNWKLRNWKGANNKPIKNQHLWQQLEHETHKHTIVWQWVKAHNGHPGNERADALANIAIDELLQDKG